MLRLNMYLAKTHIMKIKVLILTVTVKGTFITRPYKHKATYILTICDNTFMGKLMS